MSQITQASRFVSGYMASTGCEGELGTPWPIEGGYMRLMGTSLVKRLACDWLTSWQTADWFVDKHVAIVVRSLDESNKFIYKHSLASLRAVMDLWNSNTNWKLRPFVLWEMLGTALSLWSLCHTFWSFATSQEIHVVFPAGWVYHVQYTGRSLTNDVKQS